MFDLFELHFEKHIASTSGSLAPTINHFVPLKSQEGIRGMKKKETWIREFKVFGYHSRR